MAGKRIVIPNYMPALDINGDPVAGAKITFYENGTTTLKAIYTSASLNVAHPNPISANAAGVFASIFADEDEEFSVAITDADGNPISGLRNRDNVAPSLVYGQEAAESAADTVFAPAGTGAVNRSVRDKLRDIRDTRDYGVLTDGTDQTVEMIAVLEELGDETYRGLLHVATGTAFDLPAVYAAVPVDVSLWDMSFRNYSNGGYKQRRLTYYGGDDVDNDSAFMIADGHNPALILNNFRTSGSDSADDGVISPIITAYGRNPFTDSEMINWQLRYDYDATVGCGTIKDILYTPALICFGNPDAWATATVYAANSYVISDSGKVYKTTAGGTSGVTAPTGTGTISDGAVTWVYQQAGLALEAVRFQRDENGNFTQYGLGSVRHRLESGTQTVWHQLDTDGTWTARHEEMGLNAWIVSPTVGFSVGIGPSLNRLAITTQTFDYPVTGAGKTTATTISFCTPPVGRTRARLNIRFEGGATTISDYFDGGGINFLLRDGTSVIPPDGAEMEFEYDTGYSSLWREVSRSFDGLRKGTTAQRPVLSGGKGIGYLYLDTTLDADGKPIWWNGAAWVDATGATA